MKRLFLCFAKYVKLVFEGHQNGVSTNTVAVKVSKLYNFHSTLKLLSSSFIINLSTFLWRITRGITRINASDFRVYFDLSDVSKYDKGTWDIGLLSSYILFNEVNIGISHNAKLSIYSFARIQKLTSLFTMLFLSSLNSCIYKPYLSR